MIEELPPMTLTDLEIATIMRLALAEVERLKNETDQLRGDLIRAQAQIRYLIDENTQLLQDRDKARAAVRDHSEATAHIGSVYQSELEAIAEDLGVEGIGAIREAIRALQERSRASAFEYGKQVAEVEAQARRAVIAEERAEMARRLSIALHHIRDLVHALFVDFPWLTTTDAGYKLYTDALGTTPPTKQEQATGEEQAS